MLNMTGVFIETVYQISRCARNLSGARWNFERSEKSDGYFLPGLLSCRPAGDI
jgi:hypothetical protein